MLSAPGCVGPSSDRRRRDQRRRGVIKAVVAAAHAAVRGYVPQVFVAGTPAMRWRIHVMTSSADATSTLVWLAPAYVM